MSLRCFFPHQNKNEEFKLKIDKIIQSLKLDNVSLQKWSKGGVTGSYNSTSLRRFGLR
jgi:hypothetical protein